MIFKIVLSVFSVLVFLVIVAYVVLLSFGGYDPNGTRTSGSADSQSSVYLYHLNQYLQHHYKNTGSYLGANLSKLEDLFVKPKVVIGVMNYQGKELWFGNTTDLKLMKKARAEGVGTHISEDAFNVLLVGRTDYYIFSRFIQKTLTHTEMPHTDPAFQ